MASPRPYRNEYAGGQVGHASTAAGALVAAFRHILLGGARYADITSAGTRLARISIHDASGRITVTLYTKRKLIQHELEVRRLARLSSRRTEFTK